MASDDGLTVSRNEVDRLFDNHESLQDNIGRSNIHVGVSRNDGRNGVCKYKTKLTSHRFNKKITGTKTASREHTIVINEKILEDGNRDGFIDTVRHEVAHALAYELYEKYPSRQRDRDYESSYKPHGDAWKRCARLLGADPSSCHNKRDRSDQYDYYLYCSGCGNEWGRMKRCKIIKQPFNRRCLCGHSPLSSYDAGDERPDEDGVVAVDSLSWDNKSEWRDAGRP